MNKVRTLIIIEMSILIMLLVVACGNEVTDNLSDDIDNPTQSQQTTNDHTETITENKEDSEALAWPEITEDGVNEQLFMENLDIELLETIAGEIQTIVKEEAEAERENPNLVLDEGWIRVFHTERYKNVLNIGEDAMKPLYWIIYKSPNAGMYEYICATALYEISGYDFSNEDGTLTWQTSREFLERFNEKILNEKILSEY